MADATHIPILLLDACRGCVVTLGEWTLTFDDARRGCSSLPPMFTAARDTSLQEVRMKVRGELDPHKSDGSPPDTYHLELINAGHCRPQDFLDLAHAWDVENRAFLAAK